MPGPPKDPPDPPKNPLEFPVLPDSDLPKVDPATEPPPKRPRRQHGGIPIADPTGFLDAMRRFFDAFRTGTDDFFDGEFQRRFPGMPELPPIPDFPDFEIPVMNHTTINLDPHGNVTITGPVKSITVNGKRFSDETIRKVQPE